MSVWMRPLVNKEYAVAAVSYRTDGRPQPMHFTLKEVRKDLTPFWHRVTRFYFRPVLPNKNLTCVLTFMMRTINQPYLHIMRKSHFISPLIRLLCGAVILKNSHRQKSNGTLINYNSIFREKNAKVLHSSAFLLLWNFQIFQKISNFQKFFKG